MFLTLEIRWFYPGALPEALVAWLEAGHQRLAAQPARQDHYLRLAGNPALGIKLRQGGLEIKRREGAGQPLALGPRVAGTVERWRKWRFPLAAGGQVAGLLVPPGDWIAVDKQRYLKRYRLEAAGGVTPIGLDEGLVQGCEFEVSRLRAAGQAWWSVCFEAFGRAAGLEKSLMAVAGQVLDGDWPLPLSPERSYGYPAWLEKVG